MVGTGRIVAGVVVAAMAAACGSTVQLQGTGSELVQGSGLGDAGVPADSGVATGGSAALDTAGGDGLGPAGTGSDAAVGSSAGQGSGPASVSGPGSSAAGASGSGPSVDSGAATGRGFTATTVKVGIGTADDANSFGGAFGVKGTTTTGDPMAHLKVVVDDANRHGGLLGRKIELVPHNYNTAQALSDPASANQAACATWTEDHQVFAVLEPAIVEETLLACLAKTGTPLIYAGGIEYPWHYEQTYAKYPLFFNIGQMVGDRYDRIAIRRLVERGFFTPWDNMSGRPGTASAPVKVGILTTDDHDGRLALESQKRQLARHGITPARVIACPRAIQDKVACQQGAVLRLRQDGVTHIFGAGYPFMINAENQRYRPRYFITTSPRLYAQNAPAGQLVGAMGENWIPVMDVEPSEYPGDPTPATRYCKELMKDAGQLATDSTTLWTQLLNCDIVFFLKAAVEAAGALSGPSVRAGFERLGSTTQSALTWGTFLGPRNHTSATVLRDVEFRTDLGRFAYASATDHGDR